MSMKLACYSLGDKKVNSHRINNTSYDTPSRQPLSPTSDYATQTACRINTKILGAYIVLN